MKLPFVCFIACSAVVLALPAQAAECGLDKPGDELTEEDATKIYDCLSDDLHAGYKAGDKRWIPQSYVDDYRSWERVSTFPAAPGFHDGRFLVTYVNSIGAGEYLKYAEENVHIPAGTLIAKESFAVDDQGAVKKGPLFIMEKVVEGKSPDTDDWYYMMVSPQGNPVAVDVMTACSECHQGNFGHQGGLGYPVPEARVGQ
ncbi:hypothetical protein ACSSV1_005852 [Labrenzia sp. MBR-25]|jgi:hypothetical protein